MTTKKNPVTQVCIFCKSRFKPPSFADEMSFDEKRMCFSCRIVRGFFRVACQSIEASGCYSKKCREYWADQLNSLDI